MLKQPQLTKEGFRDLEKELEELVNLKRPKIVERIANARQQGDLSENSDYANAREELEFLEGRIAELESVIKEAHVVYGNGKREGIGIGTKVTLKANGKSHVFEIVGDWEADPVNKKISPDSPIGRALVGKKIGEFVQVEAPAGKVRYEILAIG